MNEMKHISSRSQHLLPIVNYLHFRKTAVESGMNCPRIKGEFPKLGPFSAKIRKVLDKVGSP